MDPHRQRGSFSVQAVQDGEREQCYASHLICTVHKRRTSDRVTRTLAKADVALVERLIEEIRWRAYQAKHRERLAHSRNELLESEVVDKEIRDWGRRARDQSRWNLHRRRLDTKRDSCKAESRMSG